MRILVLGGYGLIGEAVVGELLREGFAVTGLGRSVGMARRRVPQADWIAADISKHVRPEDWRPLIAGHEAIVNAAGALQDGLRDDVRAVQERAMIALFSACATENIRQFVQISATGTAPDAPTRFFRTKAIADRALRESALDWTILRPGLVIAPAAYGSTGVIRALAAFPWILPLVMAERPVQTVAVSDVGTAVVKALRGELPARTEVDLVEDESRSLRETVMAFRARFGLSPAPVITVPTPCASVVTFFADVLGWLGWRSPLRRTAMAAVASGVTGDPAPYRALTGKSLSALPQTLAALPMGVQDLWFARLWLLKPTILGVLALFFLVSGIVGLLRFDAAMFVLTSRSMPQDLAYAAVLGGSLADIVLGLLLLVRRTARPALLGMIVLTLGYLAAASLFAPGLWSDPLGALVKTVPIMVLCLVGLAVLDER